MHGFADDGGDGAEVLAACQLRDDAAVVGVDELRGYDVGKDFCAVADDGGGGLVAGAFDAENEVVRHKLYLRWSGVGERTGTGNSQQGTGNRE